MNGVTISGVGAYAPPGILANEDLEKLVDTSDEWIVQRTGMKRRHIAGPNEATSDIALPAALAALSAAGCEAKDVQCVIVATATPDYLFPATACIVAARLGIPGAAAFDVSIGCSGFVYALTTAAALIRSGVYARILVIGAETLSKLVDYTDRATCVLFGDGAGAVVVERSDEDCFLGSDLGAEGSDPSVLYLPGGGSRMPLNRMMNGHVGGSVNAHSAASSGVAGSNGVISEERLGYIQMQGQAVFKFAVQQMAGSVQAALAKAGLAPSDVDFVVPHQANKRIVDATMKMLQLPLDKCISNIDEYGNTSAASIPLALADAVRSGQVKKGNIVVFVAFGAGLSWGAVVWRWLGAPVGTPPVAAATQAAQA
ncbi:MAG: ketoacyl-ACP synthase III [Candidatus Eremiobacteraeota bacterium]|nr:ketoacyl-ACP synthase III [Candidatus Eremiobacteraeota bacterium]MBV8366635.1 ketoacyl-ACP synthase III [Candidatus Eremiobacteraeota bacterium]